MDDKTTQRLENIARELEKRKQQHQEGGGHHRRFRKALRRLLMGLAVVFLLTAAVFFFNFFRLNSDLIEGHVKQGIIPNLTQGRFHLNVGAISGNLLYGVELENVLVQNSFFESSSTFLTIPRASLKYSLFDILFGKIVLQSLVIDNPVLTLRRNDKGRGIWDFSEITSLEPDPHSSNETRWQKQIRAQEVADRYLSDIKVNNLSILVPAPEKLIKDEFAARLIRLPAATFQINSINLALRKYPGETFVSHLFRVDLPEKPDYMRFQITKLKSNGNFTVDFAGLGQNFNFAIENIGRDGRKVNIYDGRHRDRLNLELVWGRQRASLPEKIRGLNGVLRIPQIKDLVRDWLPAEFDLQGALALKVSCAEQKPLFDACFHVEISSATINLPYMPVINNLNLLALSSDRTAKLERLEFVTSEINNIHSGYFDYSDEANIGANLKSEFSGDAMELVATYSRLTPGSHRFSASLQRNSGSAEISFVRKLDAKEISYGDFNFTAGLVDKGSAAGIMPLNLLPKAMREQLDVYFSRVDLVGPFKVATRFATLDDWSSSQVNFDFDRAKIVSRINPQDALTLNGAAQLASGVLDFHNFSAAIDNLTIKTAGFAQIATQSPFVSNYALALDLVIADGKSFSITSERLQSSLGLTHKPDFDNIELQGKHLGSVVLDSQTASNSVNVAIDKLRFLRHGKALWADACAGFLQMGSFNLGRGETPAFIDAQLRLDFFGIPMETSLQADVLNKAIDSFSFKGGGSNFARLLEALKTQPEGRAFFKKYPLDVSGNFNFAMLGQGTVTQPKLDGWIRFPALNMKMPQLQARLPFYGQLKTQDDGYLAIIKAGEASLKVKDVTFDLASSNATVKIDKAFSSGGPELQLAAESGIFGAVAKADGKILWGQQKIDGFKVTLASNKIETLAAEIARIGKFAVPFTLSGAFNANAEMNGSFASPSSKGAVSFSKVNLDFPLLDNKHKAVLPARNFAGKAVFNKHGDKVITLEIKEFAGKLLDAGVSVKGKAHLQKEKLGYKPILDGLSAELNNLELAYLFKFLSQGLIPANLLGAFKVTSGLASGKFLLAGSADKMMATGSVAIEKTAVNFAALKEDIKNLSAQIIFEGRTDSGYSRLAVQKLQGVFGRSDFSIPEGWLEDPTRTGKLSLKGNFDKVYPADLLRLLAGLQIQSVKFPQEGFLSGSLAVNGSLKAPELNALINSSEMVLQYDSGQQIFTVPLGRSEVDFAFNPNTGKARIDKCELGLLGGKISFTEARGVFLPTQPFTMNLSGTMAGIDFAKLQLSNLESFRGLLDGTFKATWDGLKSRDAVFNLKFSNVYMPSLPLVAPDTIGEVGIDFIEKPDLHEGQLNFYVTSDEEDIYKGRLLIADGLFAGPHLRFEIGNSEFNPQALQLDAKLMINPQSLRQTDIGRKMKKWTVTAQDKSTGVPYVDLSVSGTWDKPELMSRQVKRQAEKRVKRNIIGRIFGGHRPHKASVEELMQWFPGWKKGL